jgi:hypothetical protein
MQAEHLKGWLKGAKLEEDPKTGPANVGVGEDWEALVKLVQTVWDEGKIPTQLGWVVTVLIPKGGGDYRGIGLLKPIWKVIERVITSGSRRSPCTTAFTAAATGGGPKLR